MNIASLGLFAAVWGWVPPLLAVVLLVLGLFLILLVLIQRGKGGGLAGAFGGAGGSSAFGSRAGDTFTKITIYVAAGMGAAHHDPHQDDAAAAPPGTRARRSVRPPAGRSGPDSRRAEPAAEPGSPCPDPSGAARKRGATCCAA